jgi:hypothetical protein
VYEWPGVTHGNPFVVTGMRDAVAVWQGRVESFAAGGPLLAVATRGLVLVAHPPKRADAMTPAINM